jgi:hypothetical protein
VENATTPAAIHKPRWRLAQGDVPMRCDTRAASADKSGESERPTAWVPGFYHLTGPSAKRWDDANQPPFNINLSF